MSPQKRSVAKRGRTVHSTVTAEIASNNHQDVRHTFSEFVPSGEDIRCYGPEVEESDDDVEVMKPLKITSVDYCIESNTDAHNTENYAITEPHEFEGKSREAQLVVRRGQPFKMKLGFLSRNYVEKTDLIKLIFTISSEPKHSKGTLVRMRIAKKLKPRQWSAALVSVDTENKELELYVQPASDAVIGKWSVRITTTVLDENNKQVKNEDGSSKILDYLHPHPVYVLFNPWCKEDTVYMDDDDYRDEYIMNDQGRVYKGMSIAIKHTPWNYAQFEENILDCSLYLLDKCALDYGVRDDPVKIARCLSAIINSQDDEGVLVGNWSGNYKDGTSPSAWNSSNDILDQYWETKAPVRYGQCWVFSAVTTTVSRCLGIPCRSVTNYKSAHDTDGSVSIDYHYDGDMSPIDSYNNDSVWNFHVWNEAWMARPDLPSPEYGGWQAFDATPQETSGGVFQAGPASVHAIKHGELQLPYDGPFIYAEAASERFNWYHQPDEEPEWRTAVNPKPIGLHISTKIPRRLFEESKTRMKFNDARLDITENYKYPEGTEERRAAHMRSHQSSKYSGQFNMYESPPEDVKVEISNKDKLLYGQDFEISVNFVNTCCEPRVASGTIHVYSIYQTGVPKAKIISQEFSIKLQKAGKKRHTVPISVVDFAPGEKDLVDNPSFSVTLSGLVQETRQPIYDREEFSPIVPDVELTCPAKVEVDKEFVLRLSFDNPLSSPLTNCSWKIQAPKITGKAKTIPHGDVGPNGLVSYTTKLTPKKARNRNTERQINVTFSSDQLQNISGFKHIQIAS